MCNRDLAMHPTVKPVAMGAGATRDVSHRGDIVLDPIAGSGTTVVAAEKAGRRGYTMEIEPRYVDTAILRWEHMTGKKAIHGVSGKGFERITAEHLLECADG